MIRPYIKRFTLQLLVFAVVIGCSLIAPSFAHAQNAYNEGTYGTCTYNSCGITLGADATATISVTPSAGSTACSVAAANVQVTTDSSTGYTLSMTDTDTATSLQTGGGATIATTTGSRSAPTTLAANTWGYRVDGIGGFGAGPTSAVSSGTVPALQFAAMPASNATPDIIATQSTAANPSVNTNVWYGVCVDATVPSGAYSDSVTYSVVVN